VLCAGGAGVGGGCGAGDGDGDGVVTGVDSVLSVDAPPVVLAVEDGAIGVTGGSSPQPEMAAQTNARAAAERIRTHRRTMSGRQGNACARENASIRQQLTTAWLSE